MSSNLVEIIFLNYNVLACLSFVVDKIQKTKLLWKIMSSFAIEQDFRLEVELFFFFCNIFFHGDFEIVFLISIPLCSVSIILQSPTLINETINI